MEQTVVAADNNEEKKSINFVKRAVLKSDNGGNTYNVEIEDLIKEPPAAPRVSLYDQLSKTIAERRSQKIEGKPEGLSAEDQEFVDRVMKQKDDEVLLRAQEILEFKRQKIMHIHAQTDSSANQEAQNELLLVEKKTSNTTEDLPVTIIKKKKKKQVI